MAFFIEIADPCRHGEPAEYRRLALEFFLLKTAEQALPLLAAPLAVDAVNAPLLRVMDAAGLVVSENFAAREHRLATVKMAGSRAWLFERLSKVTELARRAGFDFGGYRLTFRPYVSGERWNNGSLEVAVEITPAAARKEPLFLSHLITASGTRQDRRLRQAYPAACDAWLQLHPARRPQPAAPRLIDQIGDATLELIAAIRGPSRPVLVLPDFAPGSYSRFELTLRAARRLATQYSDARPSPRLFPSDGEDFLQALRDFAVYRHSGPLLAPGCRCGQEGAGPIAADLFRAKGGQQATALGALADNNFCCAIGAALEGITPALLRSCRLNDEFWLQIAGPEIFPLVDSGARLTTAESAVSLATLAGLGEFAVTNGDPVWKETQQQLSGQLQRRLITAPGRSEQQLRRLTTLLEQFTRRQTRLRGGHELGFADAGRLVLSSGPQLVRPRWQLTANGRQYCANSQMSVERELESLRILKPAGLREACNWLKAAYDELQRDFTAIAADRSELPLAPEEEQVLAALNGFFDGLKTADDSLHRRGCSGATKLVRLALDASQLPEEISQSLLAGACDCAVARALAERRERFLLINDSEEAVNG